MFNLDFYISVREPAKSFRCGPFCHSVLKLDTIYFFKTFILEYTFEI